MELRHAETASRVLSTLSQMVDSHPVCGIYHNLQFRPSHSSLTHLHTPDPQKIREVKKKKEKRERMIKKR